jgi:hypothetical protein
MCQTCGHLVALTSSDGIKMYQANCKQWECDDCRPYKVRKLRAQILSGLPNKMLTLTCRGGIDGTPLEHRKILGENVQLLMKRIKRTFHVKALPYFVVIEATAIGEPHAHLLLRAPFIPQRWLSAMWQELTGWPVVDIRQIRDRDHAMYYVTKYLSKKPARFGTMKRFWRSRDWQIERERPKLEQKKYSEPKLLKGMSIAKYREVLIADGWEITSQRSTSIEAKHPGGARAPPLSDCMVEMSELYPKRHAKQKAA